MKKKTILFVILVFLLSIFTFTSCDNAPKDDSQGTGGGCAEQWKPFFCEYTADKETYDLSDVTLTFSFGYLDYDALRDYYNYCVYRNEQDKIVDPGYDLSELLPIKFYLFFKSFGNMHYVKTIDNIASEEYRGRGSHVEDITVPEELFYNEYGLIQFMITDAEDGVPTVTEGSNFCRFYYHKEGETVRISNEDLAPEYKYQFRNRTNTLVNFSHYSDSSRQDFCAIIVTSYKEPSDTSDLQAKVYLGRLYDEKEKSIPAVDIYIEAENASGEKKRILAKTIDDYMTDKYRCKRTYDYYGRVREVIFNHYETISIPNDFFNGENGKIDLHVCESGTQNILTEVGFKYKIVFFDYGDEKSCYYGLSYS